MLASEHASEVKREIRVPAAVCSGEGRMGKGRKGGGVYFGEQSLKLVFLMTQEPEDGSELHNPGKGRITVCLDQQERSSIEGCLRFRDLINTVLKIVCKAVTTANQCLVLHYILTYAVFDPRRRGFVTAFLGMYH